MDNSNYKKHNRKSSDTNLSSEPLGKENSWELYHVFENVVYHGSDIEIKEILNRFTLDDFLIIPIVFDLISNKKIELLEFLHNRNINLTYQDADGANGLHVACGASGSLESVKFLIENNILTDINKESAKFGDTPLTLAICYGHQDILSYLKKKYFINSISFKDLYVIIDRVVSNQHRLTGYNQYNFNGYNETKNQA